MVIWVRISKTEKNTEIQSVRPTDMCGTVLSENNDYNCPMLLMRTTKTAICLQTKAIFLSLLSVLIGVLAN